MPVPPLPADEALRLSVLARYRPQADMGDAALDELVRLAAQVCGTPMAVITLLDETHQHFAASLGMDESATPRDEAFCGYAILDAAPTVVEDATADARFADHPAVVADAGIRFYAGVPLQGQDQQPLGTLCVVDRTPRRLEPAQQTQLETLARAAMAHLEARRSAIELEASRRQLSAILREAPDAFIAMDEHGVIRGWNPAAERLFGWAEEQAVGRRVSELIVPPEHAASHDAGVRGFVLSRESHVLGRPLELPALHRDGTALEIELTIGCVEQDGIAYFNAFARDIHERKAVERELDRERRFTQAVLESMQTSVVACDEHGALSLFNRAARELHGVEHEAELAPEQWADRYSLFAADGTTPLTEQTIPLARAFGGEEVHEDQIVVHRSGDRPRSMSVSGRPILDEDGTMLGAVVAMHDVTGRLDEERARRAADRNFRVAFDAAPIGMVMVGLDGRFLRANAAISAITGFSADELATQPPFAFVHPEDLAEVQGRFAEVAEAGSVSLTHRIITASGTTAWVVAHVTLLHDEDGAPFCALAQVNDITEQHVAQQQLAEQHAFVSAVVDTAASLVVVLDRDGRITTFNGACERLTGRRAEDVIGTHFWEALIPSDEVAVVREAFGTLVAGDYPMHYVNHWATADGGRRLIEWDSTALLADDGEVAFVVGTGIDITDRDATEQALRASERDLRSITTAVPSGLLRVDLDGRWTFVNPRFRELWHLAPDEPLEGFDWLARVHPDDRDQLVGAMAPVRDGHGPGEARYRIVGPDGAERWVWTRAKAEVDEDGHHIGALSTTLDVHEQHVAETAHREAEHRFRLAFEQAPIGVALIELDGRFKQVNDALCAILGYDREQLEGSTFQALTHPDDLRTTTDGLAALLRGDVEALRAEQRHLHAAGHPVWVAVSVTVLRDDAGDPTHLLAQILDVTERKRFEDRLRHMAEHDPLTGLANRRRFEGELEGHLAHCRRYGTDGALMVLDIDHFKAVNDTLGHNAGDQLILSVAATLRQQLRDTDTVARLGGDEFAILMPKADRSTAEVVAAKLVEAVREHATVLSGDRRHRVTISLGVLMFEPQEQEVVAEQALVDADLAMYDAKEAGRDGFSFFADDDYVEARTKSRLSWVGRIRDAIEDGGFALEAQPIQSLRTDQITQHELLVRMVEGHGDLIPPGAFLYIAERFGIVGEIDRWVTGQAVDLLAETAGLPHPPVLEVNISGHSMGDPGLLAHIEDRLRQHPSVDPSRLVLEVTETAAVADVQLARRFADRLGGLGCRFALDDFGAGFGSLYYLKHLPFDFLKIDGEFVACSATDRTDQLVIQAAVGLARGLGKETIAEYVGDQQTMRLLRSLGVDYAQGHLVGRPRPVAELTASLLGATKD